HVRRSGHLRRLQPRRLRRLLTGYSLAPFGAGPCGVLAALEASRVGVSEDESASIVYQPRLVEVAGDEHLAFAGGGGQRYLPLVVFDGEPRVGGPREVEVNSLPDHPLIHAQRRKVVVVHAVESTPPHGHRPSVRYALDRHGRP